MLKMLLPLCDNQAVLERAVTFIHRTAQPSAPADGPEEMFIDADFSILGEAPDVYDAYAQGIRDEYHAVDDDAFRTGRLRFLKQVEERDTIFRHLPPFCEALARENIERERQMLVNQI